MLRRTMAAAALLGASILPAEEGALEKTIPFPRDRYGEVNLVYKKCTIQTLQANNYPDEEDIEKARAAGFDAHLAKPPTLDQMERLLESLPPRQ